MTVSHAPHLSHGSLTSHAWLPAATTQDSDLAGHAGSVAADAEAAVGPRQITRRLVQALGLGAVCAALVGAPISYLVLLTVTAARGPQADLGLALRAAAAALVVIATPLSVMMRLTPAGLRLRWLPVLVTFELVVALSVGGLAGFGLG